VQNPVIETLVEAEERTHANGSSETSSPSLLELITERNSAHTTPAAGVVVGKLAGFDDSGNPLVNLIVDTRHERIVARSVVPVGGNQIGSDVVLAFEHGDPSKPVIMGSLWQPEDSPTQGPVVAELDGERVTLTAKKEITLRCGKASITLTRAGKVIVRGAYLLSRSSGVNRIKGGSVQIN
jgi:hypothetical protein